jgi:hypothetical protein
MPETTKGKESASRRYMRLLSLLDGAEGAMFTKGDPDEDVRAFSECIDRGWITGHKQHDSSGKLVSVQFMEIAAAGRLVLEAMRESERANTSAGIWEKYKWRVYGYILATIFGAAVGYWFKTFAG